MATVNGKSYSSPNNIILKKGLLLFGLSYAADPFGDDTNGLYVNSSNQLVFVHQGTSTVLGSGGGGGTPTWEDIYTADKTLSIASTTLTFAGTHASNDTFTVTNSGSGAALQLTSTGSGVDVDGTGSTWNISKAGLITCVGLTSTSDFTTTGAAVDWDLIDDNAAALSFDASGKAGVLVLVTSNGAEGVTTSGYFTATGTITGNGVSNTAANLLLTNNTVTTFGADADSSGVAVFRSTSLTTGSLLQLQLTEGTLNGGFYLTCRSVGVANVLTIGENGRIAIVGTGGSNMLAITAGDVALSDGSITLVDADNAASLSVTNNTATTASVFVFAGSGVFTGSTTSSFMTITPSGLTTGTAVYIPLAALTTGIGLQMIGNALTTGQIATITSSATAITTTGRLFSVVHSGVTGTSATLTEFSTAATDETVLMKLTASAALALGTVLDISADAMTTGTALDIGGMAALTTGKGIVVAASGTTRTDGMLLSLTCASTAATSTGRMLLVNHTGATGVSTILAEFKTAATDETILAQFLASGALAGGKVINISAAAITTGTIIDIAGVDAITTGKVLNISSNSASDGTRSLVYIVNDNALATGTTALELKQDSSGAALKITGTAAITLATNNAVIAGNAGANGIVLKNLKNAAAGTLGGTALNVEIDIGGTPYYFAVYPTKS